MTESARQSRALPLARSIAGATVDVFLVAAAQLALLPILGLQAGLIATLRPVATLALAGLLDGVIACLGKALRLWGGAQMRTGASP